MMLNVGVVWNSGGCWWRVLIKGLARSSNKQHLENTDKWYLCKAGSFSYGESLWTPPLEGALLHQ